MNDRVADASSEEAIWPENYEAPSIKPLGTIWSRTGGNDAGVVDGLLEGGDITAT